MQPTPCTLQALSQRRNVLSLARVWLAHPAVGPYLCLWTEENRWTLLLLPHWLSVAISHHYLLSRCLKAL